MKIKDLKLNEEYEEEMDLTDLSDAQMGQIVGYMNGLIEDPRETDDLVEAAHIALDQIAGFETGIVDKHVRAKTVADLVDLYYQVYGG